MPATMSDDLRLQELRSRLSRLGGAVQDVAASCLLAADELEATGSPPSEAEINSWAALEGEIQALTESIESERGQLGLSDDGSRVATGFAAWEAALAEIEETARSRGAARKTIDAALVVADVAEALKHVDDAGFAPLREVRGEAAALRARLESADWDESKAAASEVWSDAHPLTALSTLVANPDGLDDARWTALQDVVASAYGRALSTAVTRGRIVLEPEDAARLREAAREREGRA